MEVQESREIQDRKKLSYSIQINVTFLNIIDQHLRIEPRYPNIFFPSSRIMNETIIDE